MLQNLDDQVRDCMQRARECAERANGVVDPKERAEWLMLQARYVKLVRHIAEAKRAREHDEQATSLFRVLHIDDDSDILCIVAASLGRDPQFVVRDCRSGADGLTVAAEWRPDVILLDVMMPLMDGPSTLRRLREAPQTADIPVVFMTARAQTSDIEHFKSLRTAGVITKPFDPMKLAALVRNYAVGYVG
jgi:CheY-like chemotaxis protein